jgi:hypothetical protein
MWVDVTGIKGLTNAALPIWRFHVVLPPSARRGATSVKVTWILSGGGEDGQGQLASTPSHPLPVRAAFSGGGAWWLCPPLPSQGGDPTWGIAEARLSINLSAPSFSSHLLPSAFVPRTHNWATMQPDLVPLHLQAQRWSSTSSWQ